MLGGSVGTPEGGIEAQVISVPSLEAVDKLDPAQVKGKIVFYDVHMERTRDASGYGKAVPARGAGASHAAKLGAVAVLIRSIGTDHNRTPHTGAMRYQDGVAKIPAAAIRKKRDIYWPDLKKRRPTPVFDGEKLASGNRVRGPAIVETADTTVVVHPGRTLRVDKLGNFEILFGK